MSEPVQNLTVNATSDSQTIGSENQRPNVEPQNVFENNAVSHIRLPMPSLQQDNIELWFIQLAHWFTVNRITSDSTKFSTTIASLPSNIVNQVFDVVANPPTTHKFETIKAALTKHFADSEQKRIQNYVSGLQLGDRKPSHLLNDMRRVGLDTKNEQLLKGLWLQRLPVSVQTCLSTVSEPLSKLAELADSVMETIRANNSSVATISAPKVENSNDQIEQLRGEVRELTRKLNNVLSENRSRSRARNRSSTPASNNQTNGDSTECWYHQKYGSSARKCREPCGKLTSQKN